MFEIAKFAHMKKLLLILTIAFASCAKDEPPVCGTIIGHLVINQPPNYEYVWVIRDDQGVLHEMPSDISENYSGSNVGQFICLNDL